MSSYASTRLRAGSALVAIGVLLLGLAGVLILSQAPASSAHPNPPPAPADRFKKEQIYIYFEFGNGTVVKGVYSEHELLLVNGVPTNLWDKAKEAKAPNGSTTKWHVSCSDDFTSKDHGFGWSDKNWPDYDAAGDNPGWNAVYFYIVPWKEGKDAYQGEYEFGKACTGGVSTPTTTTTVAGPDPTTTTTIAGPGSTTTTTTLSTTTTAAGDTTTTAAASPGDPELPDTGPAEMLAVLLGGLGLLLMGSGSLVITGARRQTLV